IVASHTQDLQVLSDAEYSKNVHARIRPPVKEAIAGRDNSALAIKPAEGNAEGAASGTAVAAAMPQNGTQLFEQTCNVCHGQGIVAGPDSPYGELQPWVAHRDGRSDERIFRPRSPAMADRDSLSGRATATDAGRTEAAAHSRPESGAARLLLLAEDAGNHLRRLLPVQGPGGLRECNRRRSADCHALRWRRRPADRQVRRRESAGRDHETRQETRDH